MMRVLGRTHGALHGVELGAAGLTCKAKRPEIIPEGRKASVLEDCGYGCLFGSANMLWTSTLTVSEADVAEAVSLVVEGNPWLSL